jgi:hypothetical protein
MYTFSEFPIFALTSIFSSKVDLYVLLDILITQGPVTYDALIDRTPSIYIKRTFLYRYSGTGQSKHRPVTYDVLIDRAPEYLYKKDFFI